MAYLIKHTTVKWSIASLSIFETASFAQAFNRESRVSHNSKHKTVLFDWKVYEESEILLPSSTFHT